MDIAREPRILIIDDNPSVAMSLHPLLSDLAAISAANTGSSGIALAGRLFPDLILLDMQLPDMDGLAVCHHLKRDTQLASVPILFFTAGDSEDAEVSALEAGAVDYILKPLRPLIVRARVSTQLALRQKTLRLEELANIDGLTGDFNRRYFDKVLQDEVARRARMGGELSVAIIDVDHFKAYNDHLGHQEGDTCLRSVAAALRGAMRRPGEVLVRYGGEEFAVVAPGVGHRNAAAFGQWLRDAVTGLHISHPASSVCKVVSVSVGIASCTRGVECDGGRLVRLADSALYAAKQAGRNRCFAVES